MPYRSEFVTCAETLGEKAFVEITTWVPDNTRFLSATLCWQTDTVLADLFRDPRWMPEQKQISLVANVTRGYQMGEVLMHAPRGVSTELYEGEFVVLPDPSASGNRLC